MHARTARVNKKDQPNAREHALIVGDYVGRSRRGEDEVAIRVSVACSATAVGSGFLWTTLQSALSAAAANPSHLSPTIASHFSFRRSTFCLLVYDSLQITFCGSWHGSSRSAGSEIETSCRAMELDSPQLDQSSCRRMCVSQRTDDRHTVFVAQVRYPHHRQL